MNLASAAAPDGTIPGDYWIRKRDILSTSEMTDLFASMRTLRFEVWSELVLYQRLRPVLLQALIDAREEDNREVEPEMVSCAARAPSRRRDVPLVAALTAEDPAILEEIVKKFLGDPESLGLRPRKNEKRYAAVRDAVQQAWGRLHTVRQRLVASNVRLAVRHARNWASRAVPFEDLVAEGAIGLFRAVDKFDPDRGFRFSTYALHWMKHAMRRHLSNHARVIRVPCHLAWKEKRVRILAQHHDVPEIAKLVNATERSVRFILDDMRHMTPSSLEAMTPSGTPVANTIAYTGPSPEDLADSGEQGRIALDAVDELPDRLRTIIVKRFGLEGEPRTLAEIGEDFDLSRERVRQLEGIAIDRLRRKISGAEVVEPVPRAYRRRGEPLTQEALKELGPGEIKLKELAHRLGVGNRRYLSAVLGTLVRDGLAERVRHGVYRRINGCA
ncbi:hypothetical protein LCGC14_2148620, partial [marine sediment metagenome]